MVTIYTDGACRIEESIGAYAYYVDESLKGSSPCKGFVSPTCCELLAVICALNRLKKLGYDEVLLKTDSQYIVYAYDKSSFTPRSHKKMVHRLWRLVESFKRCEFVWLPEGSENGNRIAHAMASARCREVRKVA